jgi:hypothetical protein
MHDPIPDGHETAVGDRDAGAGLKFDVDSGDIVHAPFTRVPRKPLDCPTTLLNFPVTTQEFAVGQEIPDDSTFGLDGFIDAPIPDSGSVVIVHDPFKSVPTKV